MIDAILIGFGVIAFAIGVAVYVVQFRQGLHADASKKWPTNPGTIVSSSMEQVPENKGATERRCGTDTASKVRTMYSSRIFWGGNEGRQKHMTLVVTAYPAGGSVPVYHDPQNPA